MRSAEDTRQAAPWLSRPLASYTHAANPMLSRRAYRCLTAAGYRTLADVAAADPADLAAIPGFGAICRGEVKRLIRETRYAHALALMQKGVTQKAAAAAAGIHPETLRVLAKARKAG